MVQVGEAHVSDTDATKPAQVKLWQNPQFRRARHDHRNRDCDLREEDILDEASRTRCYYSHSYGYIESLKRIYPSHRVPNRLHGDRDKYNGHERTRWRNASHEMRKLDPADREDIDFLNNQHRHSLDWWY